MRARSRGSAVGRTAASVAVVAMLSTTVSCGSSGANRKPAPAAPTPAHVAGQSLGHYRMPGAGPELLVTRERHPRGGSQLHLYVEPSLSELTGPGGRPLVPFIATDTPPTAHVSTGCAPGVLIVRTASPTVPPGVLAAWDVGETRYRLRGATATELTSKLLAKSVPARDLAHRFPDVAHGSVLAGCTR